MRFLRNNGLSLFFLVLFLVVLVAQAIAGHALYNDEEIAHAKLLHEQPETLSFWRYVTSSSFGQAVMENWQSEYLQFVDLRDGERVARAEGLDGVQEGRPGGRGVRRGAEDRRRTRRTSSPKWAKAQGPAAVAVLQLAAAGDGLDLARLLVRPVGDGLERLQRRADPARGGDRELARLRRHADFWEATLQNWQSEFLAVGSMVIFSVYLRQRGSSQSKPVGAPHHATAEEG